MIKLQHAQLAFTPIEAANIWLECWMESYAPRAEVVIVPGLPWTLAQLDPWFARARSLASPTNTQTPRYEPADWTDHLELKALQRALRPHGDRLTLDYLPEFSAPVVWAKAQPAHGDLVVTERAKVPVTDCSTTFESFIQRRSKRERQRIRRMLADFGATGEGYVFAVHDQPRLVASLLPECLNLEQAGWKGQAKTAILDDPAHTRFYTQLAERGALHGMIRLATLRRHGRLIAFEYCLVWNDRMIALKTAYDEAVAAVSPGHMLAVLHIRHCCQDPAIALYDVTGNGLTPSQHVMRYADRLETLYTVSVFAPSMRGQILRRAAEIHARLRILKRVSRNVCR